MGKSERFPYFIDNHSRGERKHSLLTPFIICLEIHVGTQHPYLAGTKKSDMISNLVDGLF